MGGCADSLNRGFYSGLYRAPAGVLTGTWAGGIPACGRARRTLTCLANLGVEWQNPTLLNTVQILRAQVTAADFVLLAAYIQKGPLTRAFTVGPPPQPGNLSAPQESSRASTNPPRAVTGILYRLPRLRDRTRPWPGGLPPQPPVLPDPSFRYDASCVASRQG